MFRLSKKQIESSDSISPSDLAKVDIKKGDKYQVVFTSPLMTGQQLKELIDSGLFQEWLQIMMKRRKKRC